MGFHAEGDIWYLTGILVFQFPLWDSLLGTNTWFFVETSFNSLYGIHFKYFIIAFFGSKSFNSLYGILNSGNPSHARGRTFNSLYGILGGFAKKFKVAYQPFNSLYGIHKFYCAYCLRGLKTFNSLYGIPSSLL